MQPCGSPVVHSFSRLIRPVATPCYSAPGCDGPAYRSLVVVRSGDPAARIEELRGRICAVNAWDSHRSEERRVGEACVRTCRSRWSPYHYKKNKHTAYQNPTDYLTNSKDDTITKT